MNPLESRPGGHPVRQNQVGGYHHAEQVRADALPRDQDMIMTSGGGRWQMGNERMFGVIVTTFMITPYPKQ